MTLRERLTHQPGRALPSRVIEALDVIGFPRFLRDRFLSLRRDHPCIGVVLIRMKCGLLTVDQGDLGPQLFGTITTAIP